MTAGMADIIAAHGGYSVKLSPQGAFTVNCHGCGRSTPARGEGKLPRSGAPIHAAHVAEELGKAGFGNLQEAKAEALLEEAEVFGAGAWNDAYIIGDVRDDADAAVATAAWLRERAAALTPDPLAVALADPEGHALVKAIHDRKATIPAEQDWDF